MRSGTKAPASVSAGLLARKGDAAPKQEESAKTEPKVGRISLTFRVTPDMHERLRLASFERRQTVQELLEEAVDAYLPETS